MTVTTTAGLIRCLERGFSFKALQALASHSGMTVAALASLIGLPERTLTRRRATGRLAPEESERLLRIAGTFEKAVDLFEGDVPAAVRWITAPRKAFDNHSPLAYSRTEPGAKLKT